MKQTLMPARATRMRLCGKQFDSEDAAKGSPRGQLAGARVERCPDKTCGKWHVRGGVALGVALTAPVLLQRPRRATGFPARVKLAVRTRAGMGDPADAVCENCGRHLGRLGGQIQHRHARKAGGSRDPITNGITNAALLCGTPFTGCHGKCEARDPLMKARGWWIETGAGPEHDPRYVHVVLWSGDAPWWLGADGSYLFESPGMAAA